MKRREFLTLIGGAVAFRPLAGHAQPAESARRIGMLIGTFAKADREGQDRIAAFLDTFQKLGWSDGRNFRMDYHWGAGNSEEIAVTAKELLRATPDVIVVLGTPRWPSFAGRRARSPSCLSRYPIRSAADLSPALLGRAAT